MSLSHWATYIRDDSVYGSANERRRYIFMPPLIGWAHTQNHPSGFLHPWTNENKTFLMPISVKNKTHFLLNDIIITSANKIKAMQLCFSKKEIKKL